MTSQERNEFVAGIIPWAIKYCHRLNPRFCRVMGEDLKGELWLWFLERAHRHDATKGKPSTWASMWVMAFISTKSRVFTSVRGGNQVTVRMGEVTERTLSAPERPESVCDWMFPGTLDKAIRRLPTIQRRTIRRRIAGQTLREIAKADGVSRESVRLRIDAAVVNLRECFPKTVSPEGIARGVQ